MDSSNFGLRLKELREEARLTQAQLAHKAKLSKAGIADLEQGRREPSWSTVQSLCGALGISCEAFNQEPAVRPEARLGRPRKAPVEKGKGVERTYRNVSAGKRKM